MKRCVVSYADTTHYQSKMKRLEESLKGRFDGDFISFTHHSQIGSPSHKEVPYAFKPYTIQKAIDMGYETILWLDSPIHAIKDISPVFEYIEQYGYMFFDNIGHPLGKWTNEACLNNFQVTREEAMNICQIMACCFGLSLKNIDANLFFSEYMKCAKHGLYNGGWESFRHDQSCASHIIHKKNLKILNGHETFFIYDHFRSVFTISDSVCLVSS